MRACALATCRFSLVISVANSARAVSAASRSASKARDGLGGIVGEILAAAVERTTRRGSGIGDAGDGRLELAAFLLVLCDRQRQGPFAALDGGCGVAHLLIEDQKGCPVFQFFAGGSHAAAEKCQLGS